MLRIAIDGPGGAGKSSLAKAVAKKLGIIYVDTGALYRTIGKYMLDHGIDPKDEQAVISALPELKIELTFAQGKQVILLMGEDVGESIRLPEVSMAASAVSAIGRVREYLLVTQRSIAEHNDVIMDGRDIGTVILPYAEVKIFLTASPEARAKRRYDELMAKGVETTYEQVFTEMAERDKNDSTRAIAPCVPAEDAVFLDNSDLNAEETVEAVLKIIAKEKKLRKKRGSRLYMFLRAIVAPIYRFFARVKVIGKENMPMEGGYVLCCNHIGVNDIFLLGTVYRRQLHFLSKKEWFSVPLFKHLFSALGAIPLDRGGKDIGALKNAIECAKSGKTVAIFPQGHRYPGVNPKDTPIKSGGALIAYKAHCGIIPVCIRTKNVKYRFLRKIEVIFGKPLSFGELGFTSGGSAEYREVMDKVFNNILELGGYLSDEAKPEVSEN